MHHGDLIEGALKLLIFVVIERNIFYEHLLASSLHFPDQKVTSEYVRVSYWRLNFELISFLLQELLRRFVYSEWMVDYARAPVGVESLKYKLRLSSFLVEQIPIQF